MKFLFAHILMCFMLLLIHNSMNKVSNDVIVYTKLGRIKGSLMKTVLGKTFFAFRGIHYAKPPTGPLRFKPPVPVTPWNDILDASEEGPSCPQTLGFSRMTEDCLTINVYTKQLPTGNVTSDVKLPVIVFIHPGAFYEGSGQTDIPGPRYLLDQDVVFVTMNHRLGALGLLNLGDHRAYGNYLFRDQILALKFVKNHIDAFGGDPNSVTLTGQSSGARSIVLHMVSPMSKGLFHRAIAMSGASTPIPSQKEHMKKALKQAKFLNCTADSVDEMFECLKNKSADDYAKSMLGIMDYFGKFPLLYWYPSIEPESLGDDRFIPDQPEKIIKSGKINSVPLIIGVTEDESAYKAFYEKDRMEQFYHDLNTRWYELAPIVFQYERDTNRSRFISDELYKYYFGDQQISQDLARVVGKIFAHTIVNFPVYRNINLLSEFSTSPVYFYKFSYQGPFAKNFSRNNVPKDLIIHGDDLQYVFSLKHDEIYELPIPLYDESYPEHRMVKRLTMLWAHFAKTGEPLPNHDLFDKVTWEPYNKQTKKYLQINDTFSMKSHLLEKDMEFWDKLFPCPY